MIRETIHYSGRVQGVGFRHTTATLARAYPVTGYVQNLADGRVKLVAEGDAADVEAFVDAVQDAMGGHIADVVSARSVGSGEFGAPGEPGSFRVKL
jgi:acylphosphatase